MKAAPTAKAQPQVRDNDPEMLEEYDGSIPEWT